MQHELELKRYDTLANSGIGFDSHNLQCIEEQLALAGKEPIGYEALDRSHGASKCISQRTND
jgi:hypothetical protein